LFVDCAPDWAGSTSGLGFGKPSIITKPAEFHESMVR
jgi:hypothetical protein